MVAVQVAVGVPAFVIDVDEPHAPLDHPPCQQAGPRERRLVGIGSVHFERGAALAAEVHQLGSRGLQPVGHFVRRDPRGDFGIADDVEPAAIERPHEIERVALQIRAHSGRARDIEDRVALIAEPHAAIDGGQKSARPVGRAAADARAGRHHDKGRQIARLATPVRRRPTIPCWAAPAGPLPC